MRVAAALVLASTLGPALAQEGPVSGNAAPLDKFINLDAKDTATRLEVVTQTLYEHEQRMIALAFQIEYAGRVNIRSVLYPAADNSLIPGYVFRSPAPKSGRRPALVIVHGGFHERFNVEWFPMIERAVQAGYVVIFPEYRGSRGYGANHYKNDYGNTDRADVVSAADYIARQSDVDGSRIGIIGESRGGMVTLLAIEKAPKRFQVAVDVVGLTDFVAYMGYKPEYRRQEVAREGAGFKGQMPFENLDAYMQASPINNVDTIETPLLVLATTGDKIAPLQLHTGRLLDALKARGKNHESHIYDNAPGGHIFLHGDSAEHADAYNRIFEYVGKRLNP